MTHKNGMARALSILLTHEGDYFSTYCSRRARTVSTDLVKEGKSRLKGPKQVSLCHLLPFFALAQTFSAHSPLPRIWYAWLVRIVYFYTTVKLTPNRYLYWGVHPYPTQSRVPKENLALLSAFGFKVACVSFSPLSSRFIFVLALFPSTRTLALSLVAVPLGQLTSAALAAGSNRAIGTRQRGPDYLEAWKRLGSMRLIGMMT